MPAMATHRGRLFIVRAWMESADPKSFRATITQTSDSGAIQTVSATSSPEELCRKARRWAEEVIAFQA